MYTFNQFLPDDTVFSIGRKLGTFSPKVDMVLPMMKALRGDYQSNSPLRIRLFITIFSLKFVIWDS